MISFQPIGLAGQPRASAIGFHIAITIGDRTTGSPAGASDFGLPLRCQASPSRVRYALEAGLNTTGFSLPSRIAVIASPDPIALPFATNSRPSFDLVALVLNAPICSSSQLFFSLP